jgi:hypothetical protein
VRSNGQNAVHCRDGFEVVAESAVDIGSLEMPAQIAWQSRAPVKVIAAMPRHIRSAVIVWRSEKPELLAPNGRDMDRLEGLRHGILQKRSTAHLRAAHLVSRFARHQESLTAVEAKR